MDDQTLQMLQMLLKTGGGGALTSALGGLGGAGGLGAFGGGGAAALGLGSLAIPGIGVALGGAELATGLIKQHQAKIAKEKLDQPDPALAKYMSEIDRQRKSFETGSAYGNEMRELKNQEAATQEGVLRAAKGNTGSALSAIEQVGLNTGAAYGKIAQEGQARQDKYTQLYGDLVQRMEQRKYEQNAADYQQKQLDARDKKIQGFQTLLNTASLAGKQPGFGGQDIMKQIQALLGQGGAPQGQPDEYGMTNPQVTGIPSPQF